MDGLWDKARRYRRIAAALGEDEMKRKVKFRARLGSAAGDETPKREDKALAAD